ncbi:MAG: hypothetical protein LBK95_15420 [Bifidobacteriaceae bacterium]|jgi:hypothetical protein|nr:hypothetical protein [Bifidobacteriaceae bacterium]
MELWRDARLNRRAATRAAVVFGTTLGLAATCAACTGAPDQPGRTGATTTGSVSAGTATEAPPSTCPEEWNDLEPFTKRVASGLSGADVLACSNADDWIPSPRHFFGWEKLWAEDGEILPAMVPMGTGEPRSSWTSVECRPHEGVTFWWVDGQWLRGRQVDCDDQDASAEP